MTTPGNNTLQEYGRKAADTIDSQRGTAAGALERAAHALETKTTNWTTGQKAARSLHHAAGYVRDHDVNTMRDDFSRTIRRNPGYSLLAAAGLGFILARGLFRR
jgi:hypothetical protein